MLVKRPFPPPPPVELMEPEVANFLENLQDTLGEELEKPTGSPESSERSKSTP